MITLFQILIYQAFEVHLHGREKTRLLRGPGRGEER